LQVKRDWLGTAVIYHFCLTISANVGFIFKIVTMYIWTTKTRVRCLSVY